MAYNAKTNWNNNDTVTEQDLNRIEKGVSDAHSFDINDVTISASEAPTGNTASPKKLLSWIIYMIKAITGKSTWYATPATTLEAAKAHADDLVRHITPAERTGWNSKQDAIGFTPENVTNKGESGGYAGLDNGAKLLTKNLPDSILGQVKYQGTWNATSNVPALPAASTAKGYYFVVAASGTYGSLDFQIGDWVISNGVEWQKVNNTDAVPTVFGRTGNVIASNGDYKAEQVALNSPSLASTNVKTGLEEILTGVQTKAPLASPALTGTPTAPTPTAATNNNTLATTAYVTSAVALARTYAP
ncbi:hypothetical protein [Cohnella abietis]|uniref:Uncharacterized protein n=1 Tax=Cohnella abietis TaxID=2507935 RepID=A0A3T1D1R7_9BACL|nr:hypothetical protein [Cohnella abietis]BBI32057.1 hypothetical protein KCTCHS21_14560 [Cohnella abietis]